MRAMLTTPRNSSLRGRPVTLANVVAGATSRREQADRINAYWDLCSAVADYYLGLGELDEFRNCRNKVRGGQIWQQAEQALSVRIQTSQRAAMASQYRLASLMGRASSMPLPSDLPHCGSYNTRHREIFAGRASAEADELNQLLPLRHAELRAAAGKVMRAKEFLEYVASELRSDSDGQGVVEALELLALQRRAFVQIAKDYNRRIARYSELVAPGEVQAERLVAMLIRSRGTTTATRPAERGSSPSRYGRQSSATAPGEPVTFAAGEAWAPRGSQLAEEPRIDTAVTPVTGQLQQTRRHSREEKSVLVR